ncbi:hypothetical protein RRG08_049846 [Elysia crispata]|uniref:Uncharacterized protein n=1 Tax=Elysia crispata TaxID=231223 RepID=A0AAE1DM93_9GAST|nr:hypothetical protein RRG08_049846 [Elysia crispata]
MDFKVSLPTGSITARAGLRYIRCVKRIIRKCPGYKKLFTKESRADFMELLADAKATYKQAGARCKLGGSGNLRMCTWPTFLGLFVSLQLWNKTIVLNGF